MDRSLFEKNNLTVIEPYKKGLNVTVAVVPKTEKCMKRQMVMIVKHHLKMGI